MPDKTVTDMSKILNTLYRYISKPFTANLGMLVAVLLLITAIDCYGWSSRGYFKYLVYVCLSNFLFSYVITLCVGFIKNKTANTIVRSLVFALLVFFFLIDYFHWIILGGGNYFEIPVIVQNTNFAESNEFLKSFLTPTFILSIFLILACICLIYCIIRRYFIKSGKIKVSIGLALLVISLVSTLRNPSVFDESFWGKVNYWRITFTKKTPDLKEYFTDPELVVNGELPENLVVIVGESFSKFHSSLYGYDKPTNPRLAQLPDSNLILFKNVESQALSTLPNFQEFMNDHDAENDTREWYECLTIHEVFGKAGFHTTWISSQNRVGFLDNAITAYANLSDDVVFTCDRPNNYPYTCLDKDIFPVLDSLKIKNLQIDHNLAFIHITGSHHDFKSRYPMGYTPFNENDYLEKPSNQRLNLSYYDNSLHYNDSIIYEIVQRYKDEDAMIIYFSDHGMDLYYTDTNYFYYGRKNIPESAKAARQIPFMVYLTDEYKRRHPDTAGQLQAIQDKHFNTKDLLYFLMDINSISFKDTTKNKGLAEIFD